MPRLPPPPHSFVPSSPRLTRARLLALPQALERLNDAALVRTGVFLSAADLVNLEMSCTLFWEPRASLGGLCITEASANMSCR
jgi:hypothetical protein